MSQPKNETLAPDVASERAASALGFSKPDKRVTSLFGARAKAREVPSHQLTPDEQIIAASANEMRWLDVPALDDNPFQPRTVYDEQEIEDLKDSMLAVGQIQPGLARLHPDQEMYPGRYQLAIAHKRKRAVLAGGNAGVTRENAHLYIGKLWVRIAKLSDMEMRVLAIRENTDRSDLNPMDLADSYSGIRNALGDGQRKLTWAEVSKIVGLGVRQMRRYADLLDLPDAAKKKIRDKVWNERHGRALLSFEKEDPRQAILMRAIEKEGLSGAAAERRAGVIRSAYATQRDMDIADTAERSHETTVAHQAVAAGAENRAALEAGRSHLTLVPPPEAAPTPALPPALSNFIEQTYADVNRDNPEVGDQAPSNEFSIEAGLGNLEAEIMLAYDEQREEPDFHPPVVSPSAELQTIAARLEFLALDTASQAVVSPHLAGAMRLGITDCYSSLNKILAVLEDEH